MVKLANTPIIRFKKDKKALVLQSFVTTAWENSSTFLKIIFCPPPPL
jgi:hypothetical protein